MDPKVRVRPAELDDAGLLAAIIDSIERYYGAAETTSLDIVERQVKEALSSQAIHVLIAEGEAKEALGFASYSLLWPAVGATRSVYLKELFVLQENRGLGVGKALFERVVDIARNDGYSRVEWTTDRSNAEAKAFYENLGWRPSEEKIFYRIEF